MIVGWGIPAHVVDLTAHSGKRRDASKLLTEQGREDGIVDASDSAHAIPDHRQATFDKRFIPPRSESATCADAKAGARRTRNSAECDLLQKTRQLQGQSPDLRYVYVLNGR